MKKLILLLSALFIMSGTNAQVMQRKIIAQNQELIVKADSLKYSLDSIKKVAEIKADSVKIIQAELKASPKANTPVFRFMNWIGVVLIILLRIIQWFCRISPLINNRISFGENTLLKRFISTTTNLMKYSQIVFFVLGTTMATILEAHLITDLVLIESIKFFSGSFLFISIFLYITTNKSELQK